MQNWMETSWIIANSGEKISGAVWAEVYPPPYDEGKA